MLTAFVGAGGKTTAIYYYAEKLRENGRRVIITTTTHMQYPVYPYGPLCASAAEAERKLAGTSGVIAVCGTDADVTGGIHKIAGLSETDFDQCRSVSDCMLVEADGARMRPLKAPGKTEPVIPRGTGVIVVCAGLDAVGGRLGDICFRTDIVSSILAELYSGPIDNSHVITCADVAHILYRGYLFRYITSVAFESVRLYVLLNKADVVSGSANARTITELLRNLADRTPLWKSGACLRGFYTAALRKGELSYERYTRTK